MPRSRWRRPDLEPDDRLERMIAGWKRTEIRCRHEFHVQPVSAQQASKTYRCPGCGREVSPGTGHVVVWRADSVLGDDAALADRRHWHTPCWRTVA